MGGVLFACASYSTDTARQARNSAGGVYKIGTPYVIDGKSYIPKVDTSYDKIGAASWYGGEDHGDLTANGERFDMNGLTAAHPTLPMPIHVRVTSLENNRSLILRVNDRGPFKRGREIDLSRRAAEILGFKDKGTAKVRVQYVGPAPLYDKDGVKVLGKKAVASFFSKAPKTEERFRAVNAAPVSPVTISPMGKKEDTYQTKGRVSIPLMRNQIAIDPEGRFFVQAGAFSDRNNAYLMHKRLEGFPGLELYAAEKNGTKLWRVLLGPFGERGMAEKLLHLILEQGHHDAFIMTQ